MASVNSRHSQDYIEIEEDIEIDDDINISPHGSTLGTTPLIATDSGKSKGKGKAKEFDSDLAPIPPHIDPKSYSFGDLKVPRFTTYGGLSPDEAMKRVIDFDSLVKAPHIFNDIHSHFDNYTGDGHNYDEVCAAANLAGVDQFTLTPIPTTLVPKLHDSERSARYGIETDCGQVYYVDKKHVGKPLSKQMISDTKKNITVVVNPSVDDNLITNFSARVRDGKIPPEFLSRANLAMTGLHLGNPRVAKDMLKTMWRAKNASDNLSEVMAARGKPLGDHRLRFGLVGEVTLHKELIQSLFSGGPQGNVSTNVAPVREAMRLAGVVGMPWVLHCDVDKPDSLKSRFQKDKPPKYLEGIKELMRSCPNTEIIWAHAGGLGRFVKEGPHHLDELTKLMDDDSLKHVKLDISWSVVAEQATKDPAAVARWAAFLVKYQDRILFGSDTLTPQNQAKWTETYEIYDKHLKAAMLALPTGQVAWNKIMTSNFNRTIVAARDRIDAFNDHVLEGVIAAPNHFAGQETVDIKALQLYRDQVYAKNAEDPKVKNARDFFMNEKPLPEVETKPRDHKLIKGYANLVTCGTTYKHYEFNSGFSGDLAASRERKAAMAVLNAMGEQLRTDITPFLNNAPTGRIAQEFGRLKEELDALTGRIGTNRPPTNDEMESLSRRFNLLRAEVIPAPAAPPKD